MRGLFYKGGNKYEIRGTLNQKGGIHKKPAHLVLIFCSAKDTDEWGGETQDQAEESHLSSTQLSLYIFVLQKV